MDASVGHEGLPESSQKQAAVLFVEGSHCGRIFPIHQTELPPILFPESVEDRLLIGSWDLKQEIHRGLMNEGLV